MPIKTIRILGANALAAVQDFGVGIFIVALLASLCGVEILPAALLLGGVFALLPDFDVLPPILMGREVQHDHHTTLLHRPLFVLSVSGAGLFAIGGTFWALAGVICITYHYLHDTAWTRPAQTGISWGWPWSDQCWSWWGAYQRPSHQPHYAWLKRYWLQPSYLSCFEIGVGLAAITGTTLLYIGFIWYAIVIVGTILSVLSFVWITSKYL